MNPYEVLGLPLEASARQIRAAYRRLAKLHHPDHGGDPLAFARIKLAHDILLDPDRRSRYDSTGDVSEKTPDNSLAEVLSHINMAFQAAIASNTQMVKHLDLIHLTNIRLNEAIANAQKEINTIKSTIGIWGVVIARVHVVDGKPNYLADICRANITGAQELLKQQERLQENLKKAIELLKDFTFQVESRGIYPNNPYTGTIFNHPFLNMNQS